MRPVLALFLLCLVISPVALAQTYNPNNGDPPSGGHIEITYNEWPIVVTPAGKGITGKVRLDCYEDEYDEVIFNLRGLKPLGRYTAWLTTKEDGEGQTEGVARHWTGPDADLYYFIADGGGRAFYKGWLQHCPLGKYHWLFGRYHPNGDTKDIDSSIVVFKVHIKPT